MATTPQNGGVDKHWIAPDLPSRCTWHLGMEKGKSPHSHDKSEGNKVRERAQPTILKMIGNTPLIRINNVTKGTGLKCQICKH
eukprot:XP_011675155.1 PREDICTED: cystathionine beta-synthase-like [Strongylocentrotus purpuratus]